MIRRRSTLLKKRLESCQEKLLRLAWSWTGDRDQAEELVQECLTRALGSASQLRDESRLEVWASRILVNLYRDACRKRSVDLVDIDPDELVQPDMGPQELFESAESHALLESAMGQLKHETRQVISLVDIAGFSYAECAEILDVPIGTIMSRISRGREKLLMLVHRERLPDTKVVSLRRKQ